MQQLVQRFSKEFLFQFILIVILFLAIVFDKRNPSLNLSDVLFFTNYVISALFISYVLLPRFFYTKQYGYFASGTFLSLLIVILVEEFVLEKLFFPDNRGKIFHGVFPTLLDVLPIIVILVGFKFGWDAQRKQTELEQLNTKVAESQLQFLQSQVNPHFLFNNLNNLYAYALENSPKTPRVILELSSLLRYMLYDCKAKWVPLDKEIEYLTNFIRLQELQIEERGLVNFTVKGATSGKLIAPLLLVVFVENSFKHSASSMTEGILINIDLVIEGNQLLFDCSNTFSPNGNTQSLTHGIGLENAQSRLQLLYPNAHLVDICSDDSTYLVRLELNLKTADQ